MNPSAVGGVSDQKVSSSPAASDQFRRLVRRGVGVVRRYRWAVMASVLAIVPPTIVYLYTAKPLYTAQSSVLIEAPELGDNMLDRSYGRSRLTEMAIQTEADILASTSLATRVTQKLGLANDPEFNVSLRPKKQWVEAIAALNPLPYLTGQVQAEGELSSDARQALFKTRIESAVLRGLTVTTSRRSSVIHIRYTAESNEKAARIANSFAELYILDRLEASLQESRQVTGWLSDRLDALRRDVSVAETAVAQFRVANNLVERRNGETISDHQLTELTSRLAIARSELAQKQARYQHVAALARSGGENSLNTASDVLHSSLIQQLREQEAVKQRQLSEDLKTYGERHPRIIGVRADLSALQKKIGEEINKISGALSGDAASAHAGVAALEREIAALKTGVDGANRASVQLAELEREASSSRALYESFLVRFKKEAGQERIQRANARVLSPASIPVQPSSPRRLRILALSIVLSLCAGIGGAFLLDRLNGRIRNVDEAEELTGLPVLSVVPWQKNAAWQQKLDARSSLADALRSLKAILTALAGSADAKVILVTSSLPQEGKTFVSRNLAAIFASVGQRILIVDADLMQPQQHKALDEVPAQGLTQLLADPSLPISGCIRRDPRTGVDILPAGKVESASGDLLGSKQIERIFAELRASYDRIIVDAPPTLVASDTQYLGRLVDQVVFVVKWNETPRDTVIAAISHLDRIGAKPAGMVLSQARQKGDVSVAYGQYGYYGSYSGYSRQ